MHRPLLIILATSFLFGSCEKRKPSAPTKEGVDAEETTPPAPPDSLGAIGLETTGLVKLWVLALSVVETEESAETAAKRLQIVSDQLDALLDRAKKLPKVSAAEFGRLDREIEILLSEAAAGLEPERKRIFVLPPEIKDKILPVHQELLEKFRSVSRAIRDSQIETDPEGETEEPPAQP